MRVKVRIEAIREDAFDDIETAIVVDLPEKVIADRIVAKIKKAGGR
jgi:hypothetical protein